MKYQYHKWSLICSPCHNPYPVLHTSIVTVTNYDLFPDLWRGWHDWCCKWSGRYLPFRSASAHPVLWLFILLSIILCVVWITFVLTMALSAFRARVVSVRLIVIRAGWYDVTHFCDQLPIFEFNITCDARRLTTSPFFITFHQPARWFGIWDFHTAGAWPQQDEFTLPGHPSSLSTSLRVRVISAGLYDINIPFFLERIIITI